MKINKIINKLLSSNKDKKASENVSINEPCLNELRIQADQLLTLKQFDKAIEMYLIVLKEQPDHYIAWNNLASCYGQLGQYEDALKAVNQALLIKPDYENALLSKSISLLNLELYEDAIKFFDKVLFINPNNSFAKSRKDLALSRLNKQKEELMNEDKSKASNRLVSASKIIELAIKENIARNVREIKYIPELHGILFNGRDYIINEIDNIPKDNVQIYMFHAFGYLFAKANEAVIKWKEANGKQFSMYFDVGDLIKDKVNSELKGALKKAVDDKFKYGQILFQAHQDFVLEHFYDLDFDMDEEINSCLTIVIQIGIQHGLENF